MYRRSLHRNCDADASSSGLAGVYDTRKCRDAIADRGAHAVITPLKNAKQWKTFTAGAMVRNEVMGDLLRPAEIAVQWDLLSMPFVSGFLQNQPTLRGASGVTLAVGVREGDRDRHPAAQFFKHAEAFRDDLHVCVWCVAKQALQADHAVLGEHHVGARRMAEPDIK